MESKIAEVETSLNAKNNSPLIFISHDTRDADIAELFSKLLSSVSAGLLKSFRSSDRRGTQGIEYGVEWFPEIMKKLDDASDIVCLLTQHSIDRPWILYEAGVAKGKLSSTVLGIALGIPLSKANNGPFAQFQNCGDDHDSLTKLVLQLVRRLPNADPDQDVIKEQVKSFKDKLDELFKSRKSPSIEEESELKDDASVAKLFEEVKIMFKDLPSKIENRVDHDRRRQLRFHPEFMHEFLHFPMEHGNHYGFLIMISFFRNDLPWIYEIGVETYKVLVSGDEDEIIKALQDFEKVVEFTFHHPISREFTRHDKKFYFMMEEFPFMIRQYADRAMIKRKVKKKDESESPKKTK